MFWTQLFRNKSLGVLLCVLSRPKLGLDALQLLTLAHNADIKVDFQYIVCKKPRDLPLWRSHKERQIVPYSRIWTSKAWGIYMGIIPWLCPSMALPSKHQLLKICLWISVQKPGLCVRYFWDVLFLLRENYVIINKCNTRQTKAKPLWFFCFWNLTFKKKTFKGETRLCYKVKTLTF